MQSGLFCVWEKFSSEFFARFYPIALEQGAENLVYKGAIVSRVFLVLYAMSYIQINRLEYGQKT
jgi:hypothetical protein